MVRNLVVTGNARVTGITTFGDSDNPSLMLNIDATSGLPAIFNTRFNYS